jgi:hypothetical protein
MSPTRRPGSRGLAALVRLAVCVTTAGPAAAEGEEAPKPGATPGAPAAAPVPLEQLLRLPDSYAERVPPPMRAGATQKEWQGRFRDARAKIDEARVALARVERELEETASESNAWQVAAPGQPPPTEASPLSFRLTQELKRRREDLASAEAGLQDLEIQANLAGVPEEWR